MAGMNFVSEGKCPECGANNAPTADICQYCGAHIEPDWDKLMGEVSGASPVTCSKCQTVNHAFAEKCVWCGDPLVYSDSLVPLKRQALVRHLIESARGALKGGSLEEAKRHVDQACLLMPDNQAAQELRAEVEAQLQVKEIHESDETLPHAPDIIKKMFGNV